jgi:SAM-dependent methyltransferase
MGDQREYLRTVQYADDTRLSARARLHARYRTTTVPWFAWLVGLVDWPAGARVLDAGCGNGMIWSETVGSVPRHLRLTLTDLSPGMVAAAASAATRAKVAVIDAREADIQDLPFADGAFEVVVANHTLFHLPDPARGVAELARVLTPGGTLLASTNGPDHLAELNDIRAEVFGEAGRDPTFATFGRVSGIPLLLDAFTGAAWHPFEDTLACTDADDVMAFLTSWEPGDAARPEQLAQLRAAVDTRFAAGGGTFRITKDTGAFIAHR